jgi:uncharacterized membrane protein
MNAGSPKRKECKLNRIKNYVLRGTLFTALFGLLLFIVVNIVKTMDGFWRPVWSWLLAKYTFDYFEGLGIILSLIAITLMGAVLSFEVKNKNLFTLFLRFLSKIIKYIPVLNFLYSQSLNFAGGITNLLKHGMIVFARHPYWNHFTFAIATSKIEINFLMNTNEAEVKFCLGKKFNVSKLGRGKRIQSPALSPGALYFSVFFPTAPFIATGPTGVYPAEEINIPINVSWTEAFQYWITGGVVTPKNVDLRPFLEVLKEKNV